MSSLGFEYLQGWIVHSLSRQPVPVVDNDQVFLTIKENVSVFQFVPTSSCPFIGYY